MDFRQALIGSVAVHLLLILFGMHLQRQVFNPPSEERYLQIAAAREGTATAPSTKGFVQANLKAIASQNGPVSQAAPELPNRNIKAANSVVSVTNDKNVIGNVTSNVNRVGGDTSKTALVDNPEANVANGKAESDTSAPVQPGGPVPPQLSGQGQPTGMSHSFESQSVAEMVDVRPVRNYSPVQSYPAQARLHNWEGRAVLQGDVQLNGRVTQITVIESSGYPVLDQAAIRVFRQWRYQPALKAGLPVICRVQVPFIFKLGESE